MSFRSRIFASALALGMIGAAVPLRPAAAEPVSLTLLGIFLVKKAVAVGTAAVVGKVVTDNLMPDAAYACPNPEGTLYSVPSGTSACSSGKAPLRVR